MRQILIIILTIVLSTTFLTSGDNTLVENIEVEIVEKKPATGDKLSDDPLDFTVFASALVSTNDGNIDHNYIAPYNTYKANLAPFRPPRFLFSA